MTAYLIAMVDVENPEEYQEYVRRNTAIVQCFGGQFVIRGGRSEVLEGDMDLPRMVMIAFPSVEAVRTWYQSPEYQEIVPIRQRNARARLLAIVEGV